VSTLNPFTIIVGDATPYVLSFENAEYSHPERSAVVKSPPLNCGLMLR